MRQKIILLSTIIIIMDVAAASNPDKSKYVNFMKEGTLSQCQDNIERDITNILAPIVYNKMTESKNYYLFTIYETRVGEQDMKTIGIFNNFFPLSSKKIPLFDKPSAGV